jgi:predicted DsbA family dithiol-disulfide isomerase
VRVRFIVYYDYLCPWCYNATVRLRQLEKRHADTVELEWRSFLLRPEPRPGERSLEKFRRYTESWLRPAAEPDSGTFCVWQGDAGPPSHSVPPHAVAKAALAISRAAFDRLHDGLFHAYFAANRDITDPMTLRAVWNEWPVDDSFQIQTMTLAELVFADYREALDLGITGVPAVRPADLAHVVSAHATELYERWRERLLAERIPIDEDRTANSFLAIN